MIKRAILVMTHGKFGIELVNSVSMIMGELEDVYALGLLPGQSVDDLKKEAFDIVEKNKELGIETFILCDILGGSPCNIAMSCMAKDDVKIFTGVSMPMIIELIASYKTEQDIDILKENIKNEAVSGIKFIDKSLIMK